MQSQSAQGQNFFGGSLSLWISDQQVKSHSYGRISKQALGAPLLWLDCHILCTCHIIDTK